MSVTWHSRWRLIAARIDGLSAAARLLFDSQRDDDFSVCTEYLGPQMKAIIQDLADLFDAHSGSLPPNAVGRFSDLLSRHQGVFNRTSFLSNLPSQLALLAGVRTELDYLLSDQDARIQSLAERAFIHLQHLIVSDTDVGDKWQRAFAEGELKCEKLGAAHLLSHGVWTFKADAGTGGRTDLILGTRAVTVHDVRRASEGLVLTEWKRLKGRQTPQVVADRAFAQSEKYSAGALAGFELAGLRYIVLVSAKPISTIPDRQGRTATYRHVNIAVCPGVPSRAIRS